MAAASCRRREGLISEQAVRADAVLPWLPIYARLVSRRCAATDGLSCRSDLAEVVLLVPTGFRANLPDVGRDARGLMTTHPCTRIGRAAACSFPC